MLVLSYIDCTCGSDAQAKQSGRVVKGRDCQTHTIPVTIQGDRADEFFAENDPALQISYICLRESLNMWKN